MPPRARQIDLPAPASNAPNAMAAFALPAAARAAPQAAANDTAGADGPTLLERRRRRHTRRSIR